MSLHRQIPPPPLVLAIHPAPAHKTRKQRKREDEERAQAKAPAGTKAKAIEGDKVQPKVNDPDAAAKVIADNVAGLPLNQKNKDKDNKEAPDTHAKALQANNDSKQLVAAGAPTLGGSVPQEAKAETEASDNSVPPPVRKPATDPIRLLCPVPVRPVRARLELNPARPYPPVRSDPRGAYHKYAKALGQTEDVYFDVTKDGWLAPIWRERPEREALDRLSGEAECQRQRKMALAHNTWVKREVPDTAAGILMELWNLLVDAPSHEIAVGGFWARYDWSAPRAEKHLQKVPEEAKIRARLEAEKDVGSGKATAGGSVSDVSTTGKTVAETNADGLSTESHNNQPSNANKEDIIKKSKKHYVPAQTYKYPIPTEWTREGFEEVLATVGVSCGYMTARPISRYSEAASGGLLLLTHGYLLLRLDHYVSYKPEGTTDKFEALVTTAEDRVFGDMVKAQMAEERKAKEKDYRRRKERERAKRIKEKVKRAEEDQREGIPGKSDPDQKAKATAVDATAGVHNAGKGPVKIVEASVAADQNKDNQDPAGAIIAVPVPLGTEEKEGVKADKDAQHEAEPVLVGPGADLGPHSPKMENTKKQNIQDAPQAKDRDTHGPKAGKVQTKDNKPARPFDIREAEMLVKMIGPEAANIPLADLQAALVAMEASAAADKAKGKSGALDRESGAATKEERAAAAARMEHQPLMWMWSDRIERWRWKNYAADCAVLDEGCWEERDWKVFADNWGCEAYENEQEWEEKIDLDVHDWSC